MGMSAVGYYDLSATGVPVHATAFRPVEEAALRNNPFRVFTSLLRLELVRDEILRGAALDILAQRQIFSPALLDLLDEHDQQNGLREAEAERFVAEALETFRWHSTATVSKQVYRDLHHAHRLVADVVCFRGPHINHLTPRTLDIDFVQAAMPAKGISAKAIIEGPPHRRCPILLRQTSFKAVEEPILFEGQIVEAGAHTARFGEIEQRGVALTPKGRALYDRLLAEAKAGTEELDAVAYSARLAKIFERFPDSHDELRRQGLAFYRYAAADHRKVRDNARDGTVDDLVVAGALGFEPIIYEDFLPVSAAGIFQSNLGDGGPLQSYKWRKPGAVRGGLSWNHDRRDGALRSDGAGLAAAEPRDAGYWC